MDERSTRLTRTGLAAAVATAVAASVCCIGPILAATLGLTSLATLVRYEPLRPMLIGATVLLLIGAFVLAYRRPAECAPGSMCESAGADRVQRINRTALWVLTATVVIILTFPTWSTWLFR